MFDEIKKAIAPNQNSSTLVVEPHVEQFHFSATSKKRFALPIQLITLIMVGLGIFALGFWVFFEDTLIMKFVVGIQAICLPFYLPALYFYLRFSEKEKHTQVELDTKYKFIQYKDPKENLLFHSEQIERCEIRVSLLIPYEVDYMYLTLKGGKRIFVSSLIVDPRRIVRTLEVPFSITRKWVNLPPKGWKNVA